MKHPFSGNQDRSRPGEAAAFASLAIAGIVTIVFSVSAMLQSAANYDRIAGREERWTTPSVSATGTTVTTTLANPGSARLNNTRPRPGVAPAMSIHF